MAAPPGSNNLSPNINLEEDEVNLDQLLLTLPKHKAWISTNLFQYNGFWYDPTYLRGAFNSESHFKALDSDIVLVTLPKSGTTWLKAILFTLTNRHRHPVDAPHHHHPLSTHTPHRLVPFLEAELFLDNQAIPDLSSLPSPRIFASHTPITFLPSSIRGSGSKIVYLCRDPRDTLISFWHFANSIRKPEDGALPLEEALEMFCKGVSMCGPFWDHVLGYWKASLEEPSKVFFLKYEDMKRDPALWLKRVAEFLGCPFSSEEVKDGVVERIVGLCSFDHLSNLEVNRNGKSLLGADNKAFFRRGEVGDWANYLSPEMAEKLNKIGEEKLSGSGLKL